MGDAKTTRRAVLFDLDDTLYPERRLVLSSFAAVAREVERRTGRPCRPVFRALVRALRAGERYTALQAMCRRCGVPESLVPVLTDVIRRHPPRLRLPEASRCALIRMRRDWRLGIVTNGRPMVQAGKVEALGLMPLVDVVVYAEDCAPGGKPAVEPFEAALWRLDVAPGRTVFVGDRLDTDVAGAQAAGLRTLLVARRGVVPDSSVAPDRVVASLWDVPRVATELIAEGGARVH